MEVPSYRKMFLKYLKCLTVLSLFSHVRGEVCRRALDIVFLVENSNFMLHNDWPDQRHLIYSITEQFDENARFAAVTFNGMGKVEFFLCGSNDQEYLRQKVGSLQLVQGHCNVAQGLRTVRERVLKEAVGDRPNVPNVVAVIQNGWPTQDRQTIPQEVAQLKSHATIVTIGIGDYIEEQYMDILEPVGKLRAGFGNFSVDTAKDAATMICNSVPNPPAREVGPLPQMLPQTPPAVDIFAFKECRETRENFYNFEVTSLQSGRFLFRNRYMFTVVLVVNVATYDDYTNQNYEELNRLIQRVDTDDDSHLFEVLGVPTNILGGREPGRNEELLNGLRYVRPGNGFTPTFQLTQKYDVNGMNEHPLYTFLKSHCDGPTEWLPDRGDMRYSPIRRNDIAWNFEKILIGKDGIPYRRYNPWYPYDNIYNDVMHLLNQNIS